MWETSPCSTKARSAWEEALPRPRHQAAWSGGYKAFCSQAESFCKSFSLYPEINSGGKSAGEMKFKREKWRPRDEQRNKGLTLPRATAHR